MSKSYKREDFINNCQKLYCDKYDYSKVEYKTVKDKLYYSNLGIEYPYKVFEDKKELLDEIKKG